MGGGFTTLLHIVDKTRFLSRLFGPHCLEHLAFFISQPSHLYFLKINYLKCRYFLLLNTNKDDPLRVSGGYRFTCNVKSKREFIDPISSGISTEYLHPRILFSFIIIISGMCGPNFYIQAQFYSFF